VPRLGSAEGFDLLGEIGVKGRQLNPGSRLGEIQYITLGHAKGFDDLLGQQDSVSVADFA
jgi:hypothetical protein